MLVKPSLILISSSQIHVGLFENMMPPTGESCLEYLTS